MHKYKPTNQKLFSLLIESGLDEPNARLVDQSLAASTELAKLKRQLDDLIIYYTSDNPLASTDEANHNERCAEDIKKILNECS